MKLIVNSKTLKKAIDLSLKVIPSKVTIDELKCILISIDETKPAMVISSTDLETSVTTITPIEEYVKGEVTSFIVDAKKLSEMIATIGDIAIEIELKKHKDNGDYVLLIEAGLLQAKIIAHSSDSFYKIPIKPISDSEYNIEPVKFVKALEDSVPFASNDDFRPILQGINLELKNGKIVITTTDTKILTNIKISDDILVIGDNNEKDLIIPKKTAKLLKSFINLKLPTITISFTDKHIFFQSEDIIISSLLLDGKYIDYHKGIPKGDKIKILVDKDILLNSILRASYFSAPEFPIVQLFVEKDTNLMVISAEEHNLGINSNDIIELKETLSERVLVCFNSKNLQIALANLSVISEDSNNIIIEYFGSDKAILIYPEVQSSFIITHSLVMPYIKNI